VRLREVSRVSDRLSRALAGRDRARLRLPERGGEWLVGTEPEKFLLPSRSDLRYNWVHVRLAAIDAAEMRELVSDAWRMVVPKRVAAAYDRGESE